MIQEKRKEIFILFFIVLTFTFIILEGILTKNINNIKGIMMLKPLFITRQFAILFNTSYSLVVGIRGIYRSNIGFLIVYYILIAFTVYRKIFQFTDFPIGVLFIVQVSILGLSIFYFTVIAYKVFKDDFYRSVKFLGVNKKIINAYIIRCTLKSVREAFFLYSVLITLYVSYEPLFPFIKNEYKWWKNVYILGYIITIWNEDDENKFRKAFSIFVWFAVFLELLINRFIRSLVRGISGFAYDTYFTIIVLVIVILSVLDFLLYGSGLKEFLKTKDNPRDYRLEA